MAGGTVGGSFVRWWLADCLAKQSNAERDEPNPMQIYDILSRPVCVCIIIILSQDSMVETYKKMWRFMENKKPSVFTSTYEDGIARVLEGNYAFLMESTMLDYVVQRNCNLTQIGGLLDTKGALRFCFLLLLLHLPSI